MSVVRANLDPYDEIRVRGGRDDRRGAWAEVPGPGGKPTGLNAWAQGRATEESPDSTGRDGG